MSDLLLSTLAMMGMTFLIGFFVAGVIKIIANWADFFDFYSTHRKEILDLKHTHKFQDSVSSQKDSSAEAYGKVFHKVNETVNSLKPRKRITA